MGSSKDRGRHPKRAGYSRRAQRVRPLNELQLISRAAGGPASAAMYALLSAEEFMAVEAEAENANPDSRRNPRKEGTTE